MDGDPVAEFGRGDVIDFGACDDWEDLRIDHGGEVHAHERGEASAAGFDHAEVGDVMDDRAAVGVEEHDFFACDESWERDGHGERMKNKWGESNEVLNGA